MSHPGYPHQKDSNNQTPYPPYPLSSAPYPSQSSVYGPGLGSNVSSPMYMPQPYANTGYPSPTSSASYNTPYPPSQNQPYPGYPPPQTNQPSYPSYPPSGHASYPSPPKSAYPTSNPGYPSYSPQTNQPSYSSYPASDHSSYPSPSQLINSGYPSNSSSGHSKYPNEEQGSPQSSHCHSSYHSSNTGVVIKTSPTVVPAHPFDSRNDAEVLRKAMKGFGTDEKSIIDVLTKRSHAQRQEIVAQFKTLFGKDLIKELKSELSGNFEKTIIALMTPLTQLYVKELHDAISGLGTDETVLIQVLCSLTNAEIRTIREAYHKTYNSNLESDLKGDTSGHFRRLMVSLCNAGRDESTVTNPEAAAADAQALYKSGEKQWGTDESVFNMVICQRNHAQLQLVFQEYERISGHDIEKAIKKEFSGNIQDGLLGVIRAIKSKPAFFANCLNKSMKGLGTKDKNLIRLVVTRCEVDMGDIKREYAAIYGKSLVDDIKGDTSGDYRKCLLALVGEA